MDVPKVSLVDIGRTILKERERMESKMKIEQINSDELVIAKINELVIAKINAAKEIIIAAIKRIDSTQAVIEVDGTSSIVKDCCIYLSSQLFPLHTVDVTAKPIDPPNSKK